LKGLDRRVSLLRNGGIVQLTARSIADRGDNKLPTLANNRENQEETGSLLTAWRTIFRLFSALFDPASPTENLPLPPTLDRWDTGYRASIAQPVCGCDKAGVVACFIIAVHFAKKPE
jgi:hypothetical protein